MLAPKSRSNISASCTIIDVVKRQVHHTTTLMTANLMTVSKRILSSWYCLIIGKRSRETISASPSCRLISQQSLSYRRNRIRSFTVSDKQKHPHQEGTQESSNSCASRKIFGLQNALSPSNKHSYPLLYSSRPV